jgi:hypothetical protein
MDWEGEEMKDPMFIKLQGPRETWVQVSQVAIVQDVADGCEIRVLNDVGWTALTSYETAAAFMERLRQATVN